MLKQIQVQNYALIRQLDISFESGFTIITGETGAGKSILMGALGLLLGQRADSGILFDKSMKCIAEATFDIAEYGLREFFEDNDVDYEPLAIIRREISPSGRSRAFINDTPVNLDTLKKLGLMLVDIHSQHQNLQLGNNQFQLTVVDTLAKSGANLKEYRNARGEYLDIQKRIEEASEKAQKSRADLEYCQFQFDQLDKAKLVAGEMSGIEEEASLLNNAEEIKKNLYRVMEIISGEDKGVLAQMKEAAGSLDRILDYYPKAGHLRDRLESGYIELKDVSAELENQAGTIDLDPQRLQMLNERIDLINNLLIKHSVSSVEELIILRDEFRKRIEEVDSYEELLEKLGEKLTETKTRLSGLAKTLSAARLSVIHDIERAIVEMLHSLGIPHARFAVRHSVLEDYTVNGIDRVEFLFSANKQAGLQEISRVASGGELSRLMLSIKSLLADSLELPTIIFDEVDAGVSGEIAGKVAQIMKRMAAGKQVINITHLPQVAGKGDYHLLVYKYERDGASVTDIRLLEKEERVHELAKMLSGEELTEAAISNARELLN